MDKENYNNIPVSMKAYVIIGHALREARKENARLDTMLAKMYKLETTEPRDALIECCLVADIDAMPLIELDKKNCKKECNYVLTSAVRCEK